MSKFFGCGTLLFAVCLCAWLAWLGNSKGRELTERQPACPGFSAVDLSRSYSIGEIVQASDLELIRKDTDGGNEEYVRTSVRHTYLLLPQNDKVQTDFTEWAGKTDLAARVFRRGTHHETQGTLGQNVQYQVGVGAVKVPSLVQTAADYEIPYPLPLRPGREQNHDFVSYENTEDVVCGIRFVIRSRTLVLNISKIKYWASKTANEESLDLDGGSSHAYSIAQYQSPIFSEPKESTLVVSWLQPLPVGSTIEVEYRLIERDE